MKLIEKEKAIQLRKQGKYLYEIAKILNVTKGTLVRWFSDVEFTTEERERFANAGRKRGCERRHELSKQRREEAREQGKTAAQRLDHLHMIACVLYWAEGDKAKNSAAICNLDVDVLKIFMNFLRTYFPDKVEEVKLSVCCYLNNGISLDMIHSYWCNALEIPLKNLTKATIRTPSGKTDHIKKYGIARIKLHDTYVLEYILGAIEHYKFVGLLNKSGNRLR
jgi:hypothetical protein